MPVDTTSPDYDYMWKSWKRMTDIMGGERSIKDSGIAYLPKLSKQNDAEYIQYKNRATFFEGTSRTVEALVGFIFRKDPDLTPEDLDEPSDDPMQMFLNDATLGGRSWYDEMKDTTKQVIAKGRLITLIDFDEDEDRAFIIQYEAEDVLNWKVSRINGKMRLTHLILHELVDNYIDVGGTDIPGDKYTLKLYHQWREYELLFDADDNPYVQVTLWRKLQSEGASSASVTGATGHAMPGPATGRLAGTGPAPVAAGGRVGQGKITFIRVDQMFPTRNGFPLPDIPVVPHGTDGPKWDITRPPLEGMAAINIAMYQTSADYRNAIHFIGVPTPFAIGFGDGMKGPDIYLGSTTVWRTSELNAKVGYLELTGNGLDHLVQAINSDKEEMARLGAKMLATQSYSRYGGSGGGAGVEAYATVALRQTAETSALMKITLGLTQSLSLVMQWIYWWMNPDKATPKDCETDASVELNTDFTGVKLTGQEVQQFVAAYIAGGISFDTLFYNLDEGECYPPGTTLDAEQALIEAGQSRFLKIMGAAPQQKTAPGQQGEAAPKVAALPGGPAPGTAAKPGALVAQAKGQVRSQEAYQP
jgi:hypothetical protein